jgi:DNA-binding CsgD family transcriptional regulator
VQVVLDKSATSYAAVAVMRDDEQGPTDPEARRRMQLLEPHFRRSVGIGKIITFKTVEAAALAETLDAIKTAILLTDKNQRLVHANTAGESLLADGAAIQRVGDKVAALDAAANQSLQEMLKQATIGDVALARANVSVLLPARDGLSYLAQVLPLTGGARRTTVAGQSAVAAIFVRNARLELPHPLNVIASRYALTPTEMRVLMMIVDVGGTPAVAAALGVSQATVRTHLREIFAKTGLTRQADLVKLVASHMSPTG